VDGLFEDLAERLPRVVPFDYINLLLHDEERSVMRLHVLLAPAGSTIAPGSEFPVGSSASGFVWRTQQPVIVTDVDTDERFPLLKPLMIENGVQSFCALPLTSPLRRLGTLGFGSLSHKVYSEAELDFMQQVANQVAVAVDNVLHDEAARAAEQLLKRDRDRLRLLLDVNNAVVSHLALDDVFAAVSACLRRVIPHDGSSLLLYEPETQTYRIRVIRFDNRESFVEQKCVAPDGRSPDLIPLSRKQPTLFTEEDLQAMAGESATARKILDAGMRTFCCLPLFSHDRVLGALNVGSFQPQAFSPEDIELLEQVAQQVAIAVENGVAYRQIETLKEKLNTERLYLEDEIRTDRNFEDIIGESSALKQILDQVTIVAPTDSTVLIQGETGTGKELIARAIHNLSGRQARTFVKLNCAAIPTGLLESELFGHERGAFTGAIAQKIGRFELANGGTLFLDEIGDIPLDLQAKFLRVLQEQEFERLGSNRTIRVDIRLIAATNRDLAAMVADRQFRSDLYYRLNVFPIATPSLRERSEDVAPLVHYFTRKFARRMNKRIDSIPTAAMEALTRYHWPGNIRELENLVERAVILTRGTTLNVPLAELRVGNGNGNGNAPATTERPVSTLEDAEREHILRALKDANWRVGGPSGAAARLGMKRTTLQSKMAKLGIARPSAG
jgi:formate hydrogenlyase transcriptional activator